VQQGHVTSQVFRPTPKDEKKLSVYDGDQITAENAWIHFTEKLRYKSIGVLAISVGELKAHSLPSKPDPAPFPEHVVIDFTGVVENQIIKKAKYIRGLAVSRGWLYQAEDSIERVFLP
jgi:hypothetical protein